MKITCNSCQSKYTVSDEKVQGKTVKIKCRKCGATILVNSSGATTTNASDPAAAAADAAAGGDGATYLVNVAEGDQRSMSLQELVQAVNASTISRDTYVWADGMADWQPINQVPALVDALGSAAPAPAPEPARAAAKRDGGRGASRDLFGADAQAEAPLFSAPKAPAPKIGAGVEEQSALFSLSALTSRVGSPAGGGGGGGPSLSALASSSSSSASKPLNTEDSGLIDLKALAASVAATKESSASAAPNLLDDAGGLFQMSAPMTTATAAPTVSTPEPAKPQKNRTPLFIGIGAVVAIGAMVGVFMIASGGPPPPDPAAQATPTAANTPPPLDTIAPTAAPPPTDSAPAASASAVAANTKTPTKSGTGTGGGKAKTGPGTAAPGPASPAPPTGPKPSGGGCGCAPSDLMCNMRCSAKKK
jgi:predicted Zn finger-like uncharacterized protein